MERINISSGTSWEPIVGYSALYRSDRISMCRAPLQPARMARLWAWGDPYAQAVQTLKNIQSALMKAGATMKDVVRTRMFVTNIAEWEKIGRARTRNSSATFVPQPPWSK